MAVTQHNPRIALVCQGLLMASKRPGVRVDQVFAMGELSQRWKLGQMLPGDENLTKAIWELAELGLPWPE